MSLLDLDERLIEIAQHLDMVYTPLIDVKSYPEQVDVALVEAQLAARRIWRRSAVSAARPGSWWRSATAP